MNIDSLMGLCLGIGLSAACGFRVFVPLLVMSLADRGGHLNLASGFDWIGSTPALVTFATATALEIGAYYVPWLDNLLDSITSPAAVVAGTVVTASFITDMHPMLTWGLALIAGGGAAATTQGITVVTRAVSSVTTGGLSNPLVSTTEAGASVLVSILVIALPILGAIFVLALVYWLVKKIFARRNPVATVG